MCIRDSIGGNLMALTGDLQVNAAGDVRIAPRATVQLSLIHI